jgi:hypothetical protein
VIQVADETGNISEMLWRKKKSKRNWAEIQARLEIDYKAKANLTSITAKLPEVKQRSDETVNYYFSRAV